MGQEGEAQRAHAVVLDSLTESKQFDKIKVSNKARDNKTIAPVNWPHSNSPCGYCGGLHQLRQCPAYGKMYAECERVGHFRKVCHSGRSRVINDMEQEASQEYREDEIEMVSINSVYMNKNQSMLTAKLEMHAGNNKIMIPYKIDRGSDGNIMPWYIFKKLFPRVTEAVLENTVKKT